MQGMGSVVKPKTHRGRKYLESRAPKLEENDKRTLVLKGGHTSLIVNSLLNDLCALKNPLVQRLKWRNSILPFEDISFVERMCQKYDCSLFIIGLNSKKRPNNLVLGRMHDGEVLDMYELGIIEYDGFIHTKLGQSVAGAKPLLILSGEIFGESKKYSCLRSLLADMFRGPSIQKVRSLGIEHEIHFAMVSEKSLVMRVRRITFKPVEKAPEENSVGNSDLQSTYTLRTPWGSSLQVMTEECGPSVNFELRRCNLPSEDKWKRAHRVPTEVRMANKSPKNRGVDVFGTRVGRVHVGKSKLLDTLRPGASLRTALTGSRKRGFDRHEKPNKKGQAGSFSCKRVKH